MHSQCTLACPTLSVWSCIQVHGLGLRTETRGFKEATRNQKNKQPKPGTESFGFGWIFFLVLHCVFWFLGRKTKRNTCLFLVFVVSRSLLYRAKALAIFGFSFKNPKNTCVFFLVFALSRSLNRAKARAIFGFPLTNPKKNMRFVGFSAKRHHENQKKKTYVFDPKTKKHSVKRKKQKSSRNQKILPQSFVFWFFGFGWFC